MTRTFTAAQVYAHLYVARQALIDAERLLLTLDRARDIVPLVEMGSRLRDIQMSMKEEDYSA